MNENNVVYVHENKINGDWKMNGYEGLIGTVRNAVICSWHKRSELGGKWALGSGFAKVLADDGTSTDFGLYVREEEIVTLGIETLKPGSYIRCLVGTPDAGYETMRALEIEIYANEIEPSAQGVTNGNVF